MSWFSVFNFFYEHVSIDDKVIYQPFGSLCWCFYVIYSLSPVWFWGTWHVHEAGNKNMLSSNVTFLFLCFAGSFRNDGLKAADVLPILKEKVAFVSGEHTFPWSLQPIMSTVCHILLLMMLQNLNEPVSYLNLVVLKLALLLRKELYVDQGYPVIFRALETGPRSFSSYSETQVNEQHR